MQADFQPLADAEQRARRCIRANGLSIADGRITAVVELVKALRVKFYQNIRAGAGLILKELDDPSNLRPQLATVGRSGSYNALEVAFLICAKFVCCSLTAPSSLGVMVLSRKLAKITTRVGQIKF